MESTYSCSSFSGLVSSKRRLVLAAEFVGETEVETDGLGVADVEVAVGLGWKARLHDGVAELIRLEVSLDDVADEVGGRGCGNYVVRGRHD